MTDEQLDLVSRRRALDEPMEVRWPLTLVASAAEAVRPPLGLPA
ncbi:hypothetical protein [Amycolatopsis nalaikhensis]|uniref:Uncharacterized protein n=1 Tax=Amycolatopsis nalaikhensis TaxID=715472 RepID=A0ABY8X9Z9_9PSEU|nr:hypothetical protein [Amycolatopsis sp. 2-2]WIV53218.1 hypothetical protein QP939_30405 [Amycolatopsis sp. 2-2]